MSWYPDLSYRTMVAGGDHVRAIGWLSSNHPYVQGKVSEEFVARLREFVSQSFSCAGALNFPAFGGLHNCEFCEQYDDGRDFGVPAGPILYVAPGMVAHYVERHGYCPPAEFIAAVLASPLPDTPAYQRAAEGFCQLQEKWWQEVRQQQM